MANWYLSSVAYAAVTQWAAGTVYSLGAIRRQLATPAAGSERCFRVTTAGTSGGAEPTWNLTLNATTNDNTVVWTECTGQEAYQSAGNWTAPAANAEVLWNVTAGRATNLGSDTTYVAANHTETWNASARDWGRLGFIYSVTVAGSALPPTAASLASGATFNSTGANATFTLSGPAYFSGVTFNVGSGATLGQFVIGRSAVFGTDVWFRNSAINVLNTNASGAIVLGSTTVGSLTLVNTTVQFGAVGQSIYFGVTGSQFSWFNTPSALTGATVPTGLFSLGGVQVPALIRMEGVDLSALTTTLLNVPSGSNTNASSVQIHNCKIGAAATLSANYRLRGGFAALEFDGVAADNTYRMARGGPLGYVETSATVFRTGGATVAGTSLSWAFTASSSVDGAPVSFTPAQTPYVLAWNTVTGSAVTLTVEAIANKAAMPNSNMLWVEAGYMADVAGSPLWSAATTGPGVLPAVSPTSGAASTESWDATARANTTAYSLGAAIKTASNAGRVFFCTTAGTSAGSEPAGYATAIDGGSVTDGTAVFRAGWRLSLSITVTPEEVGFIAVRAKLVDSQNPVTLIYIDPKITVS